MSRVEDHNFTSNEIVVPFSHGNFPNQHLNLPIFGGFAQSDHNYCPNPIQLIHSSSTFSYYHDNTKTVPASEILGNSSPPFSEKNKIGNKRKRNTERVREEKPKEIIHVRAKRGQATDSHSLAERMRREKINEKLRCLQDLVPGCYKAMGMAVMLDVIINYVQSLQYQIEFLSMKLSAASMYFDFNTAKMEAAEAMQRNSSNLEIQGLEKMASEGCGGLSHFNPTWPLY